MDSTTSNETKAGPYKVIEKASGGFICQGPTKTEWTYSEEKSAQAEAKDLNAAFAAGQASREQWRPVPKKLGEFKFMSTETVLTYDPTKPKGERIRQRGTYVGEWSKTVTHYCELPKEPNP